MVIAAMACAVVLQQSAPATAQTQQQKDVAEAALILKNLALLPSNAELKFAKKYWEDHKFDPELSDPVKAGARYLSMAQGASSSALYIVFDALSWELNGRKAKALDSSGRSCDLKLLPASKTAAQWVKLENVKRLTFMKDSAAILFACAFDCKPATKSQFWKGKALRTDVSLGQPMPQTPAYNVPLKMKRALGPKAT
ncbi:MAG: hypothetical protein ABL962_08565 [Fimbriimonadaceae bacterium]